MIRFSYTKRLNEVKTDGLNIEEVYGLCLLRENNFGLLLMRIPKLPIKSFIFLLLLICGDIELCPVPHVKENLTDISKLRGIKLVHQSMRGLLSKKDILETFFTNEKFIITLPEKHIASVNFELFQVPGFKLVLKNRIAGEVGGVAMYLYDDLKWKRRTDLETDEIECIWVEVFGHLWKSLDIFKSKSFLVGCIYRPPGSSSYLRKDFNKNLKEVLVKVVSPRNQRIIYYSWTPSTG